MKGIVLAGGEGTRLHPLTISVSKQLLPVFNKPLVFYPISLLMMAGIRDILIITTPHDRHLFEKLLGNGSHYGLNLTFAAQARPEGLAQAFLIAREFLAGDSACLVLGDNLFHADGLADQLKRAATRETGATVFAARVPDPERYGVVTFDDAGQAVEIEEKPMNPRSPFAVTGLYFYDRDIVSVAERVEPSARGQLEITDVNRLYLDAGTLQVERLPEDALWLDAGTHRSLLEAGEAVRDLEDTRDIRLGYLEAIAFEQGWTSRDTLLKQAKAYGNSGYGRYLARLANMD